MKEENKVKDKYRIPEKFPYETIREIFKNPEVGRNLEFKFKKPDEPGLLKFLVEEKSFSETRVTNAIKKMKVKILLDLNRNLEKFGKLFWQTNYHQE
jgi:flap endonuclease-1